MNNQKVKVGISIGDPCGIGGEIILKSLINKEVLDFFTPIIFASTKTLSNHKNINKINIFLQGIYKVSGALNRKVNVLNIKREEIDFKIGSFDDKADKIGINSLKEGIKALTSNEIDVLAIAPLNNQSIEKYLNASSLSNYFNEIFKVSSFPLIIFDDYKVALIENEKSLQDQIITLNQLLKESFRIEKPKLALFIEENKEAEEIIKIKEIIKNLFDQKILIFGPYFKNENFNNEGGIHSENQKNEEEKGNGKENENEGKERNEENVNKNINFDALLTFTSLSEICEKHQEENFSIYFAGLPCSIVMPGLSPSYEIAGKNQANPMSFLYSIYYAIDLLRNKIAYEKLTENPLKKMSLSLTETIDEDISLDIIEES